MKQCKHCGGEISESAKFCNHCGHHLTNENENEETETDDLQAEMEEESKEEPSEENSAKQEDTALHNDAQEAEEKEGESVPVETPDTLEAEEATASTLENETPETDKQGNSALSKLKKKPNLLIFGSVALVIILVGILVISMGKPSEKKAIERFEAAIKDDNAKELAGMLTTEDEELEITEENVQGLIDLFEANPSELKFLISHLNMQASGEDLGITTASVDLVKEGKRLLFFSDYKFQVTPVHFKVRTNYKDTDIIVNGEKVATADKEDFEAEVGPFLPGEYTLKAVYDTGFFNLDTEQKAASSDPGHAPYVDLTLDGEKVSFDMITNRYEDLNSVKLFINGKDTEWDLAKEDYVGPLVTDGSMNASFEAELPWGTVKTNDIPIDTRYMEFNLGDSDELKQEMMDLVVQYNEEFMKAFTSADVSELKSAPHMQESMELEFELNMDENVEYKGSFHGVDFYLDSFELEYTYDDIWTMTVDTITYFEEAIYEKGKEEDLEKVEEEVRYELAYDKQNEDWVVIGLGYPGSMDEDKMERYKVDDPKVYTSDWGKKDKKKKD